MRLAFGKINDSRSGAQVRAPGRVASMREASTTSCLQSIPLVLASWTEKKYIQSSPMLESKVDSISECTLRITKRPWRVLTVEISSVVNSCVQKSCTWRLSSCLGWQVHQTSRNETELRVHCSMIISRFSQKCIEDLRYTNDRQEDGTFGGSIVTYPDKKTRLFGHFLHFYSWIQIDMQTKRGMPIMDSSGFSPTLFLIGHGPQLPDNAALLSFKRVPGTSRNPVKYRSVRSHNQRRMRDSIMC